MNLYVTENAPRRWIIHPNQNVIVQDVLGDVLICDLDRNIVRPLNQSGDLKRVRRTQKRG